jgi:hypothetical protein
MKAWQVARNGEPRDVLELTEAGGVGSGARLA